MNRRLWIIDPSLNTPEAQGTAEIADRWDGPCRLFQPVLRGDGPEPATGYDTEGIVVLGSAASVYENPDWMQRLSAWLRPVLEGSIPRPLLGVCFGHQLIAHIAGAEVAFNREDRAKRVGVETSDHRAAGLLREARGLRVVVSHREQVTAPPDGYRVVASRPDVPVDGLEHEALPISSYQFHPEARDEFAGRAGIAVDSIDDRLRRDSRGLIDRFLQRVRGER